jgi:hypothetical protein
MHSCEDQHRGHHPDGLRLGIHGKKEDSLKLPLPGGTSLQGPELTGVDGVSEEFDVGQRFGESIQTRANVLSWSFPSGRHIKRSQDHGNLEPSYMRPQRKRK